MYKYAMYNPIRSSNECDFYDENLQNLQLQNTKNKIFFEIQQRKLTPCDNFYHLFLCNPFWDLVPVCYCFLFLLSYNHRNFTRIT